MRFLARAVAHRANAPLAPAFTRVSLVSGSFFEEMFAFGQASAQALPYISQPVESAEWAANNSFRCISCDGGETRVDIDNPRIGEACIRYQDCAETLLDDTAHQMHLIF